MTHDTLSGAPGPREILGLFVGASWAAPVALVSALRHARTFDPRGALFTGRIEPHPEAPPSLAATLEGHVLARFSGALSKQEHERGEVLGLALRISAHPIEDVVARDGDPDLLFATIVSPLTMPIAPLSTRSDDFLGGSYWGVAPFAAGELGRVKLRVFPSVQTHSREPGRYRKLARAVEERRAELTLAARPTMTFGWRPIARIVLEAPSELDQEALRFDPFRTGRGIEPVGFVHWIRKLVYAASQRARPTHG